MTISQPARWLAALAIIPVHLAGQTTGNPTADVQTSRERHALEIFLTTIEENIVSAAEAMPADKYGFAPRDGEFVGVRTFSRQVKHLAATNYILAAAALGQEPPPDAGDEAGPNGIISKPDIVNYLKGSYDTLRRAIAAIGDQRIPVRSSPISPLQGESATRSALIVEAMIHSYDHYGQMVEYLRMNGIVPPASRR
jgi:DinB family protein